jgi:DNA-directed RNA polymerase specialized sigma24 family protein
VAAKKNAHYVDNEKFFQAMKEYKKQCVEAEDQGLEKPMLSNYIGSCIYLIATRLAYRPNFINYSYREEMVSDGIENCLKYIDNFDPDKYSNPFAYFTQIIYFAFLRRIKKENDQSKIKQKLILETPFELFDIQEHDENGEFTNSYIDFLQQHGHHEKVDYSDKKPPKKKKKSPLEDFIEEELYEDSNIG